MSVTADTNVFPYASDDDPVTAVQAMCLRLLAKRPHSAMELSKALVRRGVADDVARAVLERLTDVGLVDDRAFAQSWAISRHHSTGLSRWAIAHELRQRGVDAELITEATSSVSTEDEQRAARALVEQRLAAMADLPPHTQARRLLGLLSRKGYSVDLAQRTVREALDIECSGSAD